jgi:putative ABC transport system permease protein
MNRYPALFGSSVRLSLRAMMRQKGHTFVNIVGLAIGLATSILILLYVLFERSYDSFQAQGDRIYRIGLVVFKEGAVIGDGPTFTPPIGPAMKAQIPEVENIVRLSTPRPASILVGSHAARIDKVVFADSTFFSVLSFPLIHGDPRALAPPFSLVMTKGEAMKVFGRIDAVGETVRLNNGSDLYTVTGVVADPPANSEFRFDALISFSTLYRMPGLYLDWNGGNQYLTYVLLRKNADPMHVEQKLPAILWENLNKQLAAVGVSYVAHLHGLQDLRLHHNQGSETLRGNLIVASVIALMIFLIACVNFVNLSTAQAVPRAREVGVRKVLGADRWSLIAQFLAESLVVTAIAAVLALFFIELSLGSFGEFTDQPLTLSGMLTPSALAIAGLALLLVACAGGIYPAVTLASLPAASSLRGGAVPLKSATRNILVVLQFAVAVALGSGTLVITEQMRYVKSKDLGYQKEHMVVVPLLGDESQSKCDLLKTAIAGIPGVQAISASSEVPHNGLTTNGYFPQGSTTPMMIHVVDVDDQFFATYGLRVTRGRFFLADSPSDRDAFIINETLARMLEWSEPLAKTIRRDGDHTVIGVVRDFHFAALHDKIGPLIITRKPWEDKYSVLSVRLNTAETRATIAAIRGAWDRIVPASPFSYYFLDEAYDRIYRSEERFQSILAGGSLLAIGIATMGLLGLVTLSVRQRTKEIGMRKVLGSTATGIVRLMAGEYAKLILVANIIAVPLAAYAMNRWLENFAYRIALPWWAFVAAGGIATAVALLAAGLQSLKAALANPVISLRYE